MSAVVHAGVLHHQAAHAGGGVHGGQGHADCLLAEREDAPHGAALPCSGDSTIFNPGAPCLRQT